MRAPIPKACFPLATILTIGTLACSPNAYERFLPEYDAGADCPALFELRNEAKRSSTTTQAQQNDMNEKLRAVSCYAIHPNASLEPAAPLTPHLPLQPRHLIERRAGMICTSRRGRW